MQPDESCGVRPSTALALCGCGALLAAASALLLVREGRAADQVRTPTSLPEPESAAEDAGPCVPYSAKPPRIDESRIDRQEPSSAAPTLVDTVAAPVFDAALFASAHANFTLAALKSEAGDLADALRARECAALQERFGSGAVELEPPGGFVADGRIHAVRERELPDGRRVRERAALGPDEEPWIYRATAQLQWLENEVRKLSAQAVDPR
jgi:hypothetical protein